MYAPEVRGASHNLLISALCDNPGVIHTGSGEPLFLFHGVMGGERMWTQVAGKLADQFEVFAPTALGHHGGPVATRRPATIQDVIDGAQALLDELGIERAHLAGNSMGGWMALELARRGRALSVCALSPAGLWPDDGQSIAARTRRLRRTLALGRATRPVLPLAYRSAAVRRYAFGDIAVHGERIVAQEALALTDDMLGCAVADDLLNSTEAALGVIDPLPCPVAIYWSQLDRIFPEREYREYAARVVPGAHYEVLKDVGHVPMMDDAGLVAERIRATCALAAAT
jgi:pimeloyl-ACP methyl ester carboxylesterase